jgi:hypothetical protein
MVRKPGSKIAGHHISEMQILQHISCYLFEKLNISFSNLAERRDTDRIPLRLEVTTI